jgi:acetyl esterase/lipase
LYVSPSILRACLYLNNTYAHCPRCAALTLQSSHVLLPKTEPFFQGYELLDPAEFSEFFHPASASLSPIAQSKPTYFGPDSATPGRPSNPRMQLARLWLQLGTYLDYWTGLHEPSISDALRKITPVEGEDTATTDARLAATLPQSEHALFPQLLVTPEWPCVMLIHGSKDTAVPADSSRALHARLQDAKVETTLHIVPDMEHVFDLKPNAEQAFGELFDKAAEFLRAALLDA